VIYPLKAKTTVSLGLRLYSAFATTRMLGFRCGLNFLPEPLLFIIPPLENTEKGLLNENESRV
jgi:hypothetical protein